MFLRNEEEEMAGSVLRENITMKQKVVTVLLLAIPAMLENFLQTVVGFVDTLFVSKISLDSNSSWFSKCCSSSVYRCFLVKHYWD